MKVLDVNIGLSKVDTGKELSDSFCQVCSFCGKIVRVGPINFKSCTNLSGNQFFCPFCLRHDFHLRSSRHVLIMSYRAIVGFYYYRDYLDPWIETHRCYLSDINHMVEQHSKMGLHHPAFSYDPYSMLWFVDFNKIGKSPRKAPYADVESMAVTILSVFGLEDRFFNSAHDKMWTKYQEALQLFYEKRQRPKDRRMLIPTLSGIASEKPEFYDKTRDFLSCLLQLK